MQSPRYIVYYRVSTKGQGESGLGLEAQRSYVRHFLSGESIVEEVEEVQSAKSVENRPVLLGAIDRCKREKLHLAVAKLDRLSRRTEDALEIFRQLDGRLFAADIPNMDKFTLTIFMSIADRERELISIRTKQALAAKKAREGSVHPIKGHKANFTRQGQALAAAGRANAMKRRFSQIIHDIRRQRKAGSSYAQIAKTLNEEGNKTVTGGQFHAGTVRRLLIKFGM